MKTYLQLIEINNLRPFDEEEEYDDLEEAMEDAFVYEYENEHIKPVRIVCDDDYYTMSDMEEYWEDKGWLR